MKAAYIKQTGPPEVINYGDLPEPKIGPRDCLVKVSAVDMNPIDTYIRGGLIKANLPNPFILGCDLAGEVVEIGAEVKRFKPGTRVWATNQGMMGRQGTFAELVAVDEQWLHPLPAGVSAETAVAASLVGITAHLGLLRTAKLKSGEVVFVNGGSGAVGSSVLQIAKALGARVIATAGSPEKIEACRKWGADHVINYKTEDISAALQSNAPNGLNVWWETQREPNFDLAVKHLALRGRMILMAGRDARPQFPVGPFYTRDCSVHGFAMFNAPAEEQRLAAEDLNRWMAAGQLKPRIDRVLPLAEAATAHRLQEESTIGKSGALFGKLVLKP
ncbi:MAG TPA: NADPH:quinone reductase [Verrucomicrobiae bacterium]